MNKFEKYSIVGIVCLSSLAALESLFSLSFAFANGFWSGLYFTIIFFVAFYYVYQGIMFLRESKYSASAKKLYFLTFLLALILMFVAESTFL
jgi:hypothetical protein